MKYLEIDLNRNKPADINYIVGSLKNGRVVVVPTDTIYGLSCSASDRKAIRKIYDLKEREANKPLLILVSSITMLKKYVYLSKQQNILWNKVCSKTSPATTVILQSRHVLPAEIEAGTDALALRLPKSDFLIKIVRKLGEPIISTSFNISGQKNISDLSEVDKYFSQRSKQPDLVVDAGKTKKKKPSRLIDLREGKIKIIRK